MELISNAQSESFPAEFQALENGKQISPHSRLLPLSPEYDKTLRVIQVGGRLRRSTNLQSDTIHPLVLDPKHHVIQLLIKDYDERLLHPGPERVFAELRRSYGADKLLKIINGHALNVKKMAYQTHQPKMADLPPSRLRLCKPPFWSTGVDCFGPLSIKLGRRVENGGEYYSNV